MFQRRKRIDFRRRRRLPAFLLLLLFSLVALAGLVFGMPGIHRQAAWRMDTAFTTLRTLIHPIGLLPAGKKASLHSDTALRSVEIHQDPLPPKSGMVVATALPSQLPTPSATPLPVHIQLPSPHFELQDWNNCGPAALSMYLNFYGWEGDQFDISNRIKTIRSDRNVNVDELVDFTHQYSGMNALFRVGGTPGILKRFLAVGMPVMIEETFILDTSYWANDDRWSGHYLVLTGYDQTAGTYIAQDSFVGADRIVKESDLGKNWQSFNYVYILVYPPEKEALVHSLLGEDLNQDANRRHALQLAQSETDADPRNPFPWFNLGSNLVYFERYTEAAIAYDTARDLGLPQRMLRYQFGPFLAYFHSGRNDDLIALADYALKVTPNSEEALLWRGWAAYRQGNKEEALGKFNKAVEAHPGYQDALYAINFVYNN